MVVSPQKRTTIQQISSCAARNNCRLFAQRIELQIFRINEFNERLIEANIELKSAIA